MHGSRRALVDGRGRGRCRGRQAGLAAGLGRGSTGGGAGATGRRCIETGLRHWLHRLLAMQTDDADDADDAARQTGDAGDAVDAVVCHTKTSSKRLDMQCGPVRT